MVRLQGTRGFILIIVLALLGVLGFLALQFAEKSRQSRQLSSRHLDKVTTRLGVRSGLEYFMASLAALPNTILNERWRYFGEDADGDGALDPGEDTDGNNLLDTLTCPLDKARRCSFASLNGALPATVPLEGHNMSYAFRLPSRLGQDSVVVSIRAENEGERLDLKSEPALQPYIPERIHDRDVGVEGSCGPQPTNSTGLRYLWQGDVSPLIYPRPPELFVESIQEYFLRHFNAIWLDTQGPNANRNGEVEDVEWRGGSEFEAAPGQLFFHPLKSDDTTCYGRRLAAPDNAGWNSFHVQQWLVSLGGQPAEWDGYFSQERQIGTSYTHELWGGPWGRLTLAAALGAPEQAQWASTLSRYFTINRFPKRPSSLVRPRIAFLPSSSWPEAHSKAQFYDPNAPPKHQGEGVGHMPLGVEGDTVHLPMVDLNTAPEIVIASVLFGVQGIYELYFLANYEVDRDYDDLYPLATLESHRPNIPPQNTNYWDGGFYNGGVVDAISTNHPVPWSEFPQNRIGHLEISMPEALAMAKALVTWRKNNGGIWHWDDVRRVFIASLNSYLRNNHFYPPARGRTRYQRAEVLAEMAMASLRPEYVCARMIPDGKYPHVSFDRSMLTRMSFPGTFHSPERFSLRVEARLAEGGRSLGQSRLDTKLTSGQWLTHCSQADFASFPSHWAPDNAMVVTHPHQLEMQQPYIPSPSTVAGSVTLRPSDDCMGTYTDAYFAAMFGASMDADIKWGPGQTFIKQPFACGSLSKPSLLEAQWGGIAFPDGLVPPWFNIDVGGVHNLASGAQFNIWSGSNADTNWFNPLLNSWSLEFWIKTGFRHEVLDRITRGSRADYVGRDMYVEKTKTYLFFDEPLHDELNNRVAATLLGLMFYKDFSGTGTNWNRVYEANVAMVDNPWLSLSVPGSPNDPLSSALPTLNKYAKIDSLPIGTVAGTGGVFSDVPEGLAMVPMWGGRNTLDGGRSHQYSFNPDLKPAFGAGPSRIEPGEWHHVVVHHAPVTWMNGPTMVVGDAGRFRVVVDGADSHRWNDIFNSYTPSQDVLNDNASTYTITDVKPGPPVDFNDYLARKTPPTIAGQTWKYLVDTAGIAQWPDVEEPYNYDPSYWPGYGATMDEYIYAFYKGGGYIDDGWSWDVGGLGQYHTVDYSPPGMRGGPEGTFPGPLTLRFEATFPFSKPAVPGGYVTNSRLMLGLGGACSPVLDVPDAGFNYFKGIKFLWQKGGLGVNKMIDNIILWPNNSGWDGQTVVTGGFPQRYAPRLGYPLSERPVYRNVIRAPSHLNHGRVEKIVWEAWHPSHYSGAELGHILDVTGRKRHAVDLRVYLTDEAGNILENPWNQEGWDGSGRKVTIPVENGQIPYKVVFYNGRLPDWGTPAMEGSIPVCAEVPPVVPEPLNVENISPRLYSVSVLVRQNSFQDFRIE